MCHLQVVENTASLRMQDGQPLEAAIMAGLAHPHIVHTIAHSVVSTARAGSFCAPDTASRSPGDAFYKTHRRSPHHAMHSCLYCMTELMHLQRAGYLCLPYLDLNNCVLEVCVPMHCTAASRFGPYYPGSSFRVVSVCITCYVLKAFLWFPSCVTPVLTTAHESCTQPDASHAFYFPGMNLDCLCNWQVSSGQAERVWDSANTDAEGKAQAKRAAEVKSGSAWLLLEYMDRGCLQACSRVG